MRITRRSFLQGAAAAGAGLALGQAPGLLRSRVARAAGSTPAVLYDLTQCAGCHFCEVACQVNKGLPPETSLISFRSAQPENFPSGAFALRRHQCMHCLDPACASVCPVAAMYKTPEGPVIYRDERCLGCRYCMTACPYGVPQFDWDSGLLDKALIRKCDFCYDRQKEGKKPACIEACPTGAVVFGRRDELLTRAKQLIADHPDRYVNHIYGEQEAGGTSFLLISGVEFDKLGLPKPGDHSLPHLSEQVMGIVPGFMVAWAATLIGVTSVTRFRMKRMSEKKEGKE